MPVLAFATHRLIHYDWVRWNSRLRVRFRLLPGSVSMSQTPDLSEATLLARLQAFDGEALTDVYNQYHTAVYRYIAFRVNDDATAEDLANEVFTRLLAALRRRQAPATTVRGWLFGVAERVVADHYRKRSRWRFGWLSEDLPSPADSPEQHVGHALRLAQLRAGLHRLSADQQHVLALRFGYGLPIAEVAALIGKSEGAVKMLQARAIARLAEEVADA